MDNYAPRASLASLPPELFYHILAPTRKDDWYARAEDGNSTANVVLDKAIEYEDIAAARALSLTCRRLRVLTMHLIFESVTIETVGKLGRLRELLKASPDFGRHIKNFGFVWAMDGDYDKCGGYGEEEGSMLDLAFRNRVEMWNSIWKSNDCLVRCDPPSNPRPIAYFTYKDCQST